MPKFRLIFLAAGVSALTMVGLAPAQASFSHYSTTDKSYASKVDFAVKCVPSQVLPDDPIVFPGQPGASHSHTFSGNKSTTGMSTASSLEASAPTTCTLLRDRAAYWMPTLYNNGTAVKPYESRAYYRAGTYNGAAVKAIPFGLKMLAGNAMATEAQDAGVAGFQCRTLAAGNTVSKQALPPKCNASGEYLEASVVFPNCWDGVNLDSANHRSHLAYAKADQACDSAHKIRIPQLTFAQRYPVGATTGTVTLAAMMGMTPSNKTLHADAFEVFDPAAMQFFVNECIHKGVACEDVSEKRLPPGTTLPAAAWPSS